MLRHSTVCVQMVTGQESIVGSCESRVRVKNTSLVIEAMVTLSDD